MAGLLRKLWSDPLGLLRRGLFKKLLGPLRYGEGDGYRAEEYWNDRLARHGAAYRGPGEEGLSEEENRRMYEVAVGQVAELIERLAPPASEPDLIEVGLGNGAYCRALHERGYRGYLGLDIADALFERHRADCPGFRFVRGDVTRDPLPGEADVVLFIDVLQHVVEPEAMRRALGHVWAAVRPGGVLLLTPVDEVSRKQLFYLARWSREEVLAALPGHELVEEMPFRENRLLVLRRPAAGA